MRTIGVLALAMVMPLAQGCPSAYDRTYKAETQRLQAEQQAADTRAKAERTAELTAKCSLATSKAWLTAARGIGHCVIGRRMTSASLRSCKSSRRPMSPDSNQPASVAPTAGWRNRTKNAIHPVERAARGRMIFIGARLPDVAAAV